MATEKTPERRQTTMRVRTDILAGLDSEATKRGMSRTFLIEQITAKWLQSQKVSIGITVSV